MKIETKFNKDDFVYVIEIEHGWDNIRCPACDHIKQIDHSNWVVDKRVFTIDKILTEDSVVHYRGFMVGSEHETVIHENNCYGDDSEAQAECDKRNSKEVKE